MRLPGCDAMHNRPTAVATACLLSVLYLTACSDGTSRTASNSVRVDSAGISVVSYGGPDLPAPYTFEEEFRLGGSETRPEESFYRVHPSTVAVDQAGNLHILDGPNYKVVTFDGAGRFVRSVGRRGGGPGELGMPMSGLVVMEDDVVGVVDFARRGLVRFAADGEPLDVMPLPPSYFGGHVHASAGGIVVPVQVAQDGALRVNALIRAAASDTAHILVMPITESKAVEFPSCGMSFSGMSPIFSPTLRWAAAAERTAVAAAADYEVRIFAGDDEVGRVRRSLQPRAANLDLAIAELGEGMSVGTESGRRVCAPREVAERRGFAPVIPAIARLAVAPDGMLWVERGGPIAEPRPIDLFADDGDYRGTLPPGSPFPVAFLPDGRIAAADTDDDGITRLVVYRMNATQ